MIGCPSRYIVPSVRVTNIQTLLSNPALHRVPLRGDLCLSYGRKEGQILLSSLTRLHAPPAPSALGMTPSVWGPIVVCNN